MQAERLIFRDAISHIARTNYSTHGFYPLYPARFIPQIPRYFIREYMHNHEALLDNFAGCGTSLVEAKLLGYDSYGIEINPLGRLMTEVKTTPLDLNVLQENKKKLDENLAAVDPLIPEFPYRDMWFDKSVQERLGRLLAAIRKVHNEKARKFMLLCLAGIVRKCANADPLMLKPVFTKRMHKLVEAGRRIEVYKLFNEKFAENSQKIAAFSSFLNYDTAEAKVIGDDARHVDLPDGSIRLCVTSPPFITAQDYFRETKLEIYWTGLCTYKESLELSRQMIGIDISVVKQEDASKLHQIKESYSKKIDKAIADVYERDPRRAYIMYHYFREIRKAFEETKRVLDDEGIFALTIGDSVIRKIRIPTHEFIIDVAESVGFKATKITYDLIKTHNLVPFRNKTAGVIKTEWAIVLVKN
jgi:DNA modification methylase